MHRGTVAPVETNRAAKYKRISDDREGRELGVTRQDEDLDGLAERRGFTIAGDYEDNDISASTRSRKHRPQYKQMLEDARAGKFDVIIAYTSGRLTRRPREHEDLIELAEQHGIRFEYVKSPSFDLSTAAGRRVARILAANDAGEAEDIAERVARAARQRAENGEWHGGTPTFGLDRDLRPHPRHAAWVREATERLLAGETLYGICTEWNRQGRRTGWKQWLRTTDGGFARDEAGKRVKSGEDSPWYPRTLKRVVTSPAIAGYREHDGQLYEAAWEPIVDRDDWERVRTLLAAPERKVRGFNNGNARKYALSGLVFCAECEHVMVSMTATRLKGPSFVCSEISTGGCGKMRIAMEHLERYIVAQVFTRLDSPELRSAMATAADDIDETERDLRRAIDDDEGRLVRLTNEYDDDEITKVEYGRRRRRLDDRINANRAALAKATRARVHTRLPSGTELRQVWDDKDNVWRRTMLASIIERIEVSRHPAGVASNLTPRRGEDPQTFRDRLDLHRAQVLRQRVRVEWWH